MPGLEAIEDVVQDPGPTGLREELGAKADQAARRHEVLHPHPARAVIDHLLHPPLAQREQLRDDADVLLGGVDRDPLHGLVHSAVDLADDDSRLSHRQLEPLAPHQLDEHGELELAAPLHLPRVGTLGGHDAQRDVPDQLLVEAGLQHRRGELRPVETRKRGRVDADRDREARLVDLLHGERARVIGIGQRLADRHLGETGDRADLPGPTSAASTRSSASVT